MSRAARILFVSVLPLIVVGNLCAQQSQPVQMASLRLGQELRWQRTSPTAQQLDGPVLYQLVFRFVAHDSTLTGNGSINSPLAIANGGVNTAQLAAGAVTFSKLSFGNASNGQVLTADGSGGANWQIPAGSVTSVSNTDNFLTITSPTTTPVVNLNTANTDARYVLKAGDTMTGSLALPPNGLTVGGTELAVAGGNVSMAGDVTVGGRISLGIYVISYLPNSVPYDAPCVDANDIAISGGAWVAAPMFLRESRPTGETPTGQKGPAANAWRVSCTNAAGVDAKCNQAYVVCLSHASQ